MQAVMAFSCCVFSAQNTDCIARALVPMQNIQSPPLLLPKLQTPARVVQSDSFSSAVCGTFLSTERSLSLCKRSLNRDEFVHHGASSRRSLWSSLNSLAARLWWRTQLLCGSVICEWLLTWLKTAYGASSVWCVEYANYFNDDTVFLAAW